MLYPKLKNSVFWDVTPRDSVRTDVSEELSSSIRVTRIGEIGTTLAVTSNRRTLRRNTKSSRMVYSGMLRRVALVRNDVSVEFCASFIRVTKIGE
jgi:hypothetical protein